jgi:Fanconi-associated nuclease 1
MCTKISCWNYEKKECLFSEGNLRKLLLLKIMIIFYSFFFYLVKGPGDTLSETQKLWIETLTGFNIQVEVCHVKVWKGDDILLDT